MPGMPCGPEFTLRVPQTLVGVAPTTATLVIKLNKNEGLNKQVQKDLRKDK